MPYLTRVKAVKLAAALLVTGVLVHGTTSPAQAVGSPLSVGDAALDGSVQEEERFLVVADAPEGSEVRFKLDGVYLGKDDFAPYSWVVVAAPGSHKLNARWSGADVDASFAVSPVPSSTASPTAAPAPVSTASPTPVATASPVPSAPAAPAPPVTVTPSPTTSALPVPTPTPSGAPGQGPSGDDGTGTIVRTSAELKLALAAAKPGSVIEVADGTYTGRFAGVASGTEDAPVTIRGSRSAVLTTGTVNSGYALHITGSYWNVEGLTVKTASKGIVLDASRGSNIISVAVSNIGAEAIHFRTNSTDGSVMDSTISTAGMTKPQYGEGVYVGSAQSNWASVMGDSKIPDRSDRIVIRNNIFINLPAEGIDVKEGVTGTLITGNSFENVGYSGANHADSWIDVKGNGTVITNNSGSATLADAFQVHGVLPGWGNDSVFLNNVVAGDVPGYEVWVQANVTGTKVDCSSTTNAVLGMSNMCS